MKYVGKKPTNLDLVSCDLSVQVNSGHSIYFATQLLFYGLRVHTILFFFSHNFFYFLFFIFFLIF